MGLEYYVAFSDAKYGCSDLTPDIIKKIEREMLKDKGFVKQYGKFEWSFSKEELPYVGKINVFKTSNKGVAAAMYLTLEEMTETDMDIHVFPVTSNK